MDFSNVKSTAWAAQELGVTSGKLLQICKDFPSLAPERVGRVPMFTIPVIEALRPVVKRLADKRCAHCGNPPRNDDPAIDAKVETRQIEEQE